MRFKFKNEHGQALVIIALAAIGLVGVVGLAIDGSVKFSDRRHAQNAADTAALAGAHNKLVSLTNNVSDLSPTTGAVTSCPPPSGILPSPVCTAMQLAALNRARDNGYDNNLSSNTVKVYSPPISGPYINDTDYVQVIITSYVNTYFSRVVGIPQTKNTVEAVAQYAKGRNLTDGAMIISYDDSPNCSTGGTGGYSVEVTGSSTVNLKGGGIFVNSDETCGFKIPNCADLNITNGGSINTAGASNIDTTGCTFDPPLTKNYSQKSVEIPKDVDEIWPDVPPECSQTPQQPYQLGVITGSDGKQHDEWLIYPGFYTEFPQPALVTNKSYIYMASGIYCIDPPMDQDLSWSPVDAALLNGSTDPIENRYQDPSNALPDVNPKGVTLYIRRGGGFSLNATSPTYLDATNDPASDYRGYLVILEGIYTDHPSCNINGGTTVDINGLIFAPYCNFVVGGKAGESSSINAQLIGWDIRIDGANTINFTYDPSREVKLKRKIGLMR